MKDPILLLHGWGSTLSGERYKAAKNLLEKKGYRVFTPDMPGFGKNPIKKEALVFDDYVEFVKNFIEKNKFKKIILIGHSFGGRVAIAFTARYPKFVSKLVLTGASGIPRPLPSLKKRVVYGTTKIIGPLFSIPPFSLLYAFLRKVVYYSIGEMDYYKAGNLTKTFKNVYRVSIVEFLKKITIPTLILWGEKDTITPLADGEIMEKEIKNAKRVVVADATHKLPYENPDVFVNEIVKFLS